jgi:prephenate dehydrogenase
VAEDALRRGAVTAARSGLAELGDADLVVIAAPVPAIAPLLDEAVRAGLRGLLTDVGSTKRQVMAAASERPVTFVGGHPIAGAAQAGLAHARADLFERRDWLLVPGNADEAVVGRLEALVTALGATPRRIEADAHDRLMAYVSHLPQLLATTLMTAAGEAVGREGLAAAGPGFADMTRLAASSPDVWRGILATNADYIVEALRAFTAALPADRGSLTEATSVDALFRAAHKWASRN